MSVHRFLDSNSHKQEKLEVPAPKTSRPSTLCPPSAPRATCLSGPRGHRCLRHHRRGLRTPSGAHCGSSSPHRRHGPLGQALGDGPQNVFSAESTASPVITHAPVLSGTKQPHKMYLLYLRQVLKQEVDGIKLLISPTMQM